MRGLKLTLICSMAFAVLGAVGGSFLYYPDWPRVGVLALVGIFLGSMAAPALDSGSFPYPRIYQTVSGMFAGGTIALMRSEGILSVTIGTVIGGIVGFSAPLWVNLTKMTLRWLGLYELVHSKIDLVKSYHRLPTGSTVLIHIGKCGGRSLRNGIKNAERNANVHAVHVKKPTYREDLKYIIVARGPVPRLISAFRWRYKLVVSDGSQRDRFKGEYDVLVKYGRLNNLAEALYHEDGTANTIAQQEIRRIHHIREDISFYLRELLSGCQPSQILAVLMQENLDDDIFRVFGYKNEIRAHRNPAAEEEKALSETGLANLMRFFREDYEALIKLYCWGKIERKVFIEAI